MSRKIKTIAEKTQLTNVYHMVQSSIEAFSRVSPNIPKVFLEVVRNIYGRFDESAHCLYCASNTFDKEEKIEYLRKAKMEIFFQFSSFELLVKAKGITVGAANEVLSLLKNAYEQTSAWYSSEMRKHRSKH